MNFFMEFLLISTFNIFFLEFMNYDFQIYQNITKFKTRKKTKKNDLIQQRQS